MPEVFDSSWLSHSDSSEESDGARIGGSRAKSSLEARFLTAFEMTKGRTVTEQWIPDKLVPTSYPLKPCGHKLKRGNIRE